MSNIALASPGSVTSQILVGALAIGTDSTDIFLIKIDRCEVSQKVPYRKTTGDGDAAAAFDISPFPVHVFNFSGSMLSGAVATFNNWANIKDTTKNPSSASLKMHMATNQVVTIPQWVVVEHRILWVRDAETIPLSMTVLATNVNPTWATT